MLMRLEFIAIKQQSYVVKLYGFYYMPPSVHTVLIHGHQILGEFELSIENFSEEAQECNNKEIKRGRERHSRKSSR